MGISIIIKTIIWKIERLGFSDMMWEWMQTIWSR